MLKKILAALIAGSLLAVLVTARRSVQVRMRISHTRRRPLISSPVRMRCMICQNQQER